MSPRVVRAPPPKVGRVVLTLGSGIGCPGTRKVYQHLNSRQSKRNEGWLPSAKVNSGIFMMFGDVGDVEQISG